LKHHKPGSDTYNKFVAHCVQKYRYQDPKKEAPKNGDCYSEALKKHAVGTGGYIKFVAQCVRYYRHQKHSSAAAAA
jgi:hypothetical protein